MISCYKCIKSFYLFVIKIKRVLAIAGRVRGCSLTGLVQGFRGRGTGRAVVKCASLFSPGGDAGAAGDSRRQLPADRRTLTPSSFPAFNFPPASALFGAKVCVLVGDCEQTWRLIPKMPVCHCNSVPLGGSGGT